MEFSKHKGDVEQWFLERKETEFYSKTDFVSIYKTIVTKLKPIHSQVNFGADYSDKTSLTWHDESHIRKVIEQVSNRKSGVSFI